MKLVLETKSNETDDLRKIEKGKKGLGVRHLQTFMAFMAMLLAFAMRVDMSVAIVAMTSKTSDGGDAEFQWTKQKQDVILSSFFWGYIVLQIPAGWMSARFGSKILLAICVGVNSIVSLATPLAAKLGGWQAVCGCRVIQGLTQGFLNPSSHNFISNWAPLEEKGRLTSIIYSGGQLGTAIEMMVAGFLGASSWGWPSIFYSVGIVGCVWFVVWILIGSETPQQSKIISPEERHYIQSSLGHIGGAKKYPTPWGKIVTSLPFWALVVAHCGQNWGFWTLLTETPSYMSNVLGVTLQSNGMMSALPYLVMYVLSFAAGYISDRTIASGKVSITACRKISNSIGHWGPALSLIALTFAPANNVAIAVTLFTLTAALNAGQYTGYLVVHIDMAPNFAGVLMGITNFFANIISLIAPLTVGLILEDESDPKEWHNVFYLAAIIYFCCNLFFVIFGTCKRQTWNEPKVKNKEIELESTAGPNLQTNRPVDVVTTKVKNAELYEQHLKPTNQLYDNESTAPQEEIQNSNSRRYSSEIGSRERY